MKTKFDPLKRWRLWLASRGPKPAQSRAAQKGVRSDAGNGNDLLWGADWRPVVDELGADRIRTRGVRIARAAKSKSFAVLSNNRDASVGLWLDSAPKAPRKSYFAAQLLGDLYTAQTVVYLGYSADTAIDNPYRNKERLVYVGRAGDRDDLFCMIAVVGGLPDVDFVGTPAEVERCLFNNTDFLAEGGVLLVEDHPALSAAYQHLNAPLMRAAEPVFGFPFNPSFGDTIDAAQNVPVDKRLVTMAVIGTTVVAATVGWYFWGKAAEEALATERRLSIRAKADAARNAYLTARGNVMASASDLRAADASKALWKYFATVPLRRGGFALSGVICTGADCELVYRRDRKSATFVDFVQAHQTGERPEIDIGKIDVGVTRVTIPEAGSWPRLDLGQLAAQDDLLLRLGTVAQLADLAGVKLTFTPPSPMVVDSLERGLPPGEAKTMRRWMGTWTLEGPSDTLVPALTRMPSDITLSRVELRLSADHRNAPDVVLANGRYFAVGGVAK